MISYFLATVVDCLQLGAHSVLQSVVEGNHLLLDCIIICLT